MQHVAKQLRCVVVLGTEGETEWAKTCLANLLRTGFVDLVGSIRLVRPISASHRRTGLFGQFFRVYKRNLSRRVPLLKPVVEKEARLAGLPTLSLSMDSGWANWQFAAIKEMRPDIVLDLRVVAERLPGAVAALATYGAWFFQFGEELETVRCKARANAQGFASSVPGIWEVVSGQPVTKVTLFCQGAIGRFVLQDGWLHTEALSMARQVDACLRFGVCWPAKVCRVVVQHGVEAYPQIVQLAHGLPYPVARLILALGQQKVRAYLRKFAGMWLSEHWQVGVIHSSLAEIMHTDDFPAVDWLLTRDHSGFMADPFLVFDEANGHRIFVENYRYGRAKGQIDELAYEVPHRGEQGKTKVNSILNLPSHLSYPYLLRDGEKLYCIPESHETRQVQLYEISKHARGWEKVGVLLDDFAAIDSTVFYFDGNWWLFCTDADSDANCHLYAFYAKEPTGPWLPHLLNPIKSDVRSSRPAGKPFWLDGCFYRPAQDCSVTYGGRVVFNQIKTLTPTAYSEVCDKFLAPPVTMLDLHGIHTINSDGTLTVIDAKSYRFIPAYLFGEAKKKLRTGVKSTRVRPRHGLP